LKRRSVRRYVPTMSVLPLITEGKPNGWALIYARGPAGEALEFVQALGPVKQIFDGVLEKRQQRVKS
jgi:hypothetical protein